MWKKVSSKRITSSLIETLWPRRGVERVRHKGGLNHDERIINILFIEDMTEAAISKGHLKTTLDRLPIEGSLIG